MNNNLYLHFVRSIKLRLYFLFLPTKGKYYIHQKVYFDYIIKRGQKFTLLFILEILDLIALIDLKIKENNISVYLCNSLIHPKFSFIFFTKLTSLF